MIFFDVFLSVVLRFCSDGDHPALHSFPTRRSSDLAAAHESRPDTPYLQPAPLREALTALALGADQACPFVLRGEETKGQARSEEHTSELQSRGHLVCRLLLEKNNKLHDSPLDLVNL